jgi:sugar phosphate isomerase/epimerase
MGMLLSYGTWGMPTVPIDVAIEHCARVGYDGLSISIKPGWTTDVATLDAAERGRIRDLLDRHVLLLAGISGQTSLLEDDPDVLARNLDLCHQFVDATADFQRPGEQLALAMSAGGRPGDWDGSKHRAVERFGELARHAERRGVIVMAEPNVGSALLRPDDALWLLEQVSSPALKVDLDISHFNAQGMDPVAVIEQLAPQARHVEVKDERGLAPDHEFLIPGEGACDYVTILQTLDRVGYDYFVEVEISFMVQRRPGGYDPLAAATQSYVVLAKAFAEAGIERRRRGQPTA